MIVTAIYLIGIIVAIITGYIANRFFIKSEASPFVMEMPDYRLPKWLNVGARSWEKVRDYIINLSLIAKEMVPSTLGTISQVSGDVLEMSGVELLNSPLATVINTLSPGAAFGFMAFNLLTIPCMASVSAARAEIKSHRHFLLTLLLWALISFVSGAIVYVAVDFIVGTIIVSSVGGLSIIYLIIEGQIKRKKGHVYGSPH